MRFRAFFIKWILKGFSLDRSNACPLAQDTVMAAMEGEGLSGGNHPCLLRHAL